MVNRGGGRSCLALCCVVLDAVHFFKTSDERVEGSLELRIKKEDLADSSVERALVAQIVIKYFEDVTLKVLIHSAEEGGYWAEVPALPGCVSQGETIDELRSNIREAIEGWLLAEDAAAKSAGADQVIEVAV
jgi:predicted RNase H-like HicB family nuclease